MSTLFTPQSPEEEQRFNDQIQEHIKRYYPYQLRKNPFPLGGNYPDAYLNYTYLSSSKEGVIKDFLYSTFVRQEFNGLLVLGEYGSGKSHALHFIRDTILNDPFFGNQALCFLIQNPSVSPEDILLSLLREVKLGVVQDLVFKPLAGAFNIKYKDKPLEFLKDFSNYTQQGNLLSEQYTPSWYPNLFSLSYREFLKQLNDNGITLNKKNLQSFAQENLRADINIDSPLLLNDLIDLIAADESKNMTSWETFLSSKLMKSKKSSFGVEYYLQAFLELFKRAGIRHVYLLVDELEDLRTQRISTKSTVEYVATLRKMIQHNYKMFSLVLACTRDAWNDLTRLYPAIQDRFPKLLDLASTPSDIKQVIHNYLNNSRPKDLVVKNDWAPFTEEGVDALITSRGLVLRHVLTGCRQVLDAAVDQQIAMPIGADFVRGNLT